MDPWDCFFSIPTTFKHSRNKVRALKSTSRHFYGVVLLHFFGIRAFLPQNRSNLPVLDSNFSDAFLAIYCGIFLGSVYKSNLAIICVYFFSLNTLFVFVSRAICMLTLCQCQYEALASMSIHTIEMIWEQRSSIFPLLNILHMCLFLNRKVIFSL